MARGHVIEIEGLLNLVAGTPLHRDLELNVRRDEVMTLVGGSGSGKTQLLRVIVGLKRPAAGRVRVLDASWWTSGARRIRAARQRMGMLFQNGALYSAFSVYDNIAFPLRERGSVDEATIRSIVHSKLEQVELEPRHASLLPSSLSGGMIKRVSLARALSLSPELLVLDEPTAGVDAASQRAFAGALGGFVGGGGTVLLVAHELGPLATLVTRAVVLHHGQTVHSGPVPAPAGDHAAPGHEHVHPHAPVDRPGLWSASSLDSR
jgi:phospholipid/cholesterol/gamma-HCH transport system ATP-binding protein